MRKLKFLAIALFAIFFILACGDEQSGILEKPQITQGRSGTVQSVTDIESWFEQYLIDNIGAEDASEALSLFNIEWNNYIEWSDNAYVFPMYHFVPYGRVGYTRLFVDLSDIEPDASFYSVFPDNQDQVIFNHNDVINFNGELYTFDIIDGNIDILEYENGELVRYYHENQLIDTRGGINWPDWWAPRVVDGGTLGGWPWDNSWLGDGSADPGGGVLDCFEPCPNGYPKDHQERDGVVINCGHERDCDDVVFDFDVTVINIPGRGRTIHKKGSNTSTGGSSNSAGGNNPPNGNPKNPIDEAGLDEIEFEQLVNDVCHYLRINNITDKDCEDIALIVNANCREEDGDILEDCIEDALYDTEVEDKSCINDHNFTRKEKQFLINLDCGYLECLADNEELKDEVIDLLDSNITDACNPNLSTEDIVNNALASMNDRMGCSLEDLETELAKVDKIVTDPKLNTLCPEFDCIWSNMISGPLGTNLICNITSLFTGTGSTTNLNIQVVDFTDPNLPHLNNNATVLTRTSISGNTAIYVNSANCNTGAELAFDVFESFQHELVHALIQTTLVRSFGWQGSTFSNNFNFTSAFNLLVNNTYGPNPTEAEHKLMLDRFLAPMVDSLIEMNGGNGQYSDFVGLVLNAFPPSVLTSAGFNLTDVANLTTHSIAYINDPANIFNSAIIACE